ncbi:hypothetical protein, partial [Burkholderia gladioli]|uniref:hypothetical protein n=1 Tax=Burkholderia gladioli TaxID=28095 RepID=UPI003F7937D2
SAAMHDAPARRAERAAPRRVPRRSSRRSAFANPRSSAIVRVPIAVSNMMSGLSLSSRNRSRSLAARFRLSFMVRPTRCDGASAYPPNLLPCFATA